MADNIYDILVSDLRIEDHVYRLIDFLNNTLHNYERPVKRGFFCSDTSIRYPYKPDDTLSVPVLLYIVILPLFIMIISTWVLAHQNGPDSSCQRPRPLGVLVGTPLTALLTVFIKLATGVLAPNFYRGCGPGKNVWQEPGYLAGYLTSGKFIWQTSCNYITDDYVTDYTCSYPERQRELSRSFPCMYTSVSSFAWSYLAIWVYVLPAPIRTRAVVILISLAPPIFVGYTRLHDYRSHLSDVIAGWMLGMLIGAALAIGIKTRLRSLSDEKNVQSEKLLEQKENDDGEGEGEEESDDDDEEDEEEDTNQTEEITPTMDPRIRVCSSALLANIEGFIDDLRSRFSLVADLVLHVQLPYNNLDGYALNGWNVNDVIILCHSIDNRRLSLTDVTDAIYQKFIPKVSKFCGKESLIVIAHDFKLPHDAESQAKFRKDTESTLRVKQKTTFKCAGNVLLAGKLGEKETYDGLRDQDWDSIKDVLSNWSHKRRYREETEQL